MAALLKGEPGADDREAVFAFDEYGGTRMVRSPSSKYVLRAEGPDEFYDLETDPGERHNLVGDLGQRGRMAELEAVLHDWFRAHAEPGRDA